MKYYFLLLTCLLFYCKQNSDKKEDIISNQPVEDVSLIVLGTIQDGGSPHIGCKKNCCKDLFVQPNQSRKIISLGLIDKKNKKKFIFECGPDFTIQMKNLHSNTSLGSNETPDGIFLTHAHIGHYTGLMYLGKEAMNADKIKVFAMPRMKNFLENNGPWSQLVNKQNIELIPLTNHQTIELTSGLSVTPILVPHRDEYSETVGYIIKGNKKKVLFIPDIDKWEKWNEDIIKMISEVDFAFIDGTFYDGEEINHRNIKEIPHPFIIESMNLFKELPAKEKNKIYFIHFNHTNPVLDSNSKQAKTVLENGFHIAEMNLTIGL